MADERVGDLRVGDLRVGDVVATLDRWYDPGWAEAWDTVGLASGDPAAPVRSVHVAVDPTVEVAAEAAAAGAGLLLTHHPLWLGGTTTVRSDRRVGAVLDVLRGGGCAHLVAHTNADVAAPGVSDALGDALGLSAMYPLHQHPDRLDRWVVHVPRDRAEAVRAALADAGAGRLGAYDRCGFSSEGTGTFRPLPGAQPFVGRIGAVERVEEVELSVIAPPGLRGVLTRALRAAHPYEEPSFTVTPTETPSRRGLGRVGELAGPLTLAAFAARVADRLPATTAGIRAAGDPGAPVRTVAVAGGSCSDSAGAAASRRRPQATRGTSSVRANARLDLPHAPSRGDAAMAIRSSRGHCLRTWVWNCLWGMTR